MSDGAPPSRLEMRGIDKTFPGVRALNGVSFDCRAGEVHVVCGENGAGKSTLMKVLGGIYPPDAGTVLIDGAPVHFSHPLQAREAGIGIIHQELSLLPDRTVAENLFLGREPVRWGFLDRGAMRRGARDLLARLASHIDPDTPCGRLSIHDMQTVEIAKALGLSARILVLDEPTAALDAAESERLLALVRRLRAAGTALVYISHRMAEVMAIADRITVLKDGRKIGTAPRDALSVPDIVRMMVGRDVSEMYPAPVANSSGAEVLRIERAGNATLADIELTVLAGEIVAVAGLEDSGKSLLMRAIFGDAPFTSGRILLGTKSIVIDAPRAAIANGIGFLSDDRKGEGLALRQSVRDNALLTLRAFAPSLADAFRGPLAPQRADALLHSADVRAANYASAVGLLSGGNQQKTIIARWLTRAPRLLLFAEPTRGIDVAAKAGVYRAMRDYVAGGRAILMASSDLPEVVGVADRIVVMRTGRIAGELPAGASEEQVMALAVGHTAAGALHAAA